MSMEFLSKRINELRQAKDVSARDMSLSLGYNENYINRIENGKSMPSIEVFFYICDYFNISPNEFFDSSLSYPIQNKELLFDLKDLTENELTSIHAVVKSIKSAKNKK